jgi:hypothetical protein
VNDIMPAPSGDTNPEISLSQFGAKDRELLAAVFGHETWNIFIHLDNCENDSCTGCDPQHLAEKAAAEALQRAADWLMSQGHTIAAVALDGYIQGGESRG